VEKQTETELKAEIYKLYSECYEESSDDRRQVIVGKLWKKASRWCEILFYMDTNLLYRDIEDRKLKFLLNGIGDEIYLAITACIKKVKMPKNEFIKYFKQALVNAKNKSYMDISYDKDQDGKEMFFYRNFGGGGLKEPRIIKQIRRIIKQEGRELKHEELVNRLSELLSLSEKTIHKHLLFMYNNGENDITQAKEGSSLTTEKTPEMEDDAAEMIKDELESFLDKKREITRDLYRALFTGMCIKEGIHYFRKIWPVLDNEILEDYWKDPTVIPNDYDIYLKKRPDLKKDSAYSGASGKLKELEKELREAIIENHPEIYSLYKHSKYHK
jgi:hypothetical protein